MNKMPSIILVGFMGAGKTTVGAKLAAMLHRPLCDLDGEIVATAGMTIPEIFACKGESYFRDLETAALGAIDRLHDQVVATGGGVVERPGNWALMRALGKTVYLQAPWDVLRQRLLGGGGRPLARAQDGWEQVEALMLRREPLYRQADYVVSTAGFDSEQVVAVIAGLFPQHKDYENDRG
ncbi:MAG: hypothetical protein A2091_02875 [Desulfuromonadales bacterium GWD2_61_12]|nr:MAG: hypothetical protein A2091_02875 [Desulfuromonadales bacterium GWD2_61_12]HBT83214.1 shikimate kinase [Desulfuromonas sp.]